MIKLENIKKQFKVYKRNPGFGNAVKSLFSREYEIINALDDISFNINKGEIVGYIGPNGAGKSTTIKVICGILTPDSGSCKINGFVPWKERQRYVGGIGVVFGQRSQLWWDTPVADSFELIKDIYKIESSLYKKNLDEMTELLNLSGILKTPTRKLSLGQRMRCEIAASLLHSPEILFLDEPTIGLDAVSKIAVRNFFKEINKEHNTTIILTTHDMQDIEALCQRILLIGKGKILLDDNLEGLKKKISQEKTIVIEYRGTMKSLCPGITELEHIPGRLCAKLDTGSLSVQQAVSMLGSQVEIVDISVSGISSEEMAAKLYNSYAI